MFVCVCVCVCLCVCTLLVQVAMLIGQTVILGELVDYFTSVNTEQITQCIMSAGASDRIGGGDQSNMSVSSMAPELMQTAAPLSSTDSYLYALGKNSIICSIIKFLWERLSEL